MRALVTSPPGGWPHTQLQNVELRPGTAAEVLIRVLSVGLNPADNFQIEGRYPGGPKPPFITGRDACGVVVRGDAAGQWEPGEPVVVLQSTVSNLAHGTLCEEQWIPTVNLARKPHDWTDAEASAAPLVYQTAWKALFDVGRLRAGAPVVITGASGGVGLAAVQLARAAGAIVVALSRSPEKQQRLLEVGAHHVFSPDDDTLKEKIFAAVQTRGVPLVVENVGGPSLGTAVHLLGVHGRVSVVGLLAGVQSTIPLPALMFKRASIHGILVNDDPPEKSQAAWKQIVESMTRSRMRPVIDQQFSLEEVDAAFQKLRGDVFGKVVVQVATHS